MCFRPPGAEQSINCPECGKKITAVMGNIAPVCPFCNSDIASFVAESQNKTVSDIAKPTTPFAKPAAPSAPTAPKVPGGPASN